MMRIERAIPAYTRQVPTLACLLLALSSCNAMLSESRAESSADRADCTVCPEMIPVDGGTFLLGSPAHEAGRVEDEGPQRRISLGRFSVARFEVSVAEFRRFVMDTDYDDASGCYTMTTGGTWQFDADASWANPGFAQDDSHPAVCVSWHAANAYVDWLRARSGNERYRLLSESEWEYSARAGTTTPYWWGSNEDDFCAHTNGVDQTAKARFPGWARAGSCDDGYLYTAPVGSFASPNAFGIEDMVGNVWEWVADCYADDYSATPANGAPIDASDCEKRVFRGGAWGDYGAFYLRSAYRGAWDPAAAFANIGFRVAMTR